jgi:hypothetical protein
MRKLLLVACLPLACSSSNSGTDRDLAPADQGLTAAATQLVEECRTAGPGSANQRCRYDYRLDAARCAGKACRKLAIFFAGGEQRCDLYGGILDPLRDDGYVAVCAQIFEDATLTGDFPYHQEAARVDAVIRAIVADPGVTAAWSGEHLLLSGVSHGATAPVLAMARTKLDETPAWKGTRYTAACFFDGIYDVGALDDFVGTGDGGQPCPMLGSVLSHSRAVGRYYAQPPIQHRCDNAKCFCAPGHSADMDADTVTTLPASVFAVADWKLIECGSALDACTKDVIPAAPIQTLCQNIDTDPSHTCVYESMPNDSHSQCAGVGIARCRDWFDANAR